MFDFIQDMNNYESRKIGRNEVNELTVSTAFTSDEGYETAIIDKNGVHPVERYKTIEKAEKGHKIWCKEAKTVETIIKLGWLDDLVEPEVITIER